MGMSGTEWRFHRRFAVKAFNQAWKYLDKKTLNEDEGALLLHLAHTSYYHWDLVGNDRNRAIAFWQLSKAYSLVGDPQLATSFALVGLRMCKDSKLQDLMPSMEEAAAKAFAVAGDYRAARRHLATAKAHLGRLKLDKEDRVIFESQIAATEDLLKGEK